MAKSRGKRVNLAIVGCGGMAGAHLRGYEELLQRGEDRFRIVAAVDEARERAEGFAAHLGSATGWEVAAFGSVDELLDSGLQVDGADICSPHGLHHVLGCQLLQAGVNVLIEKPVGITVKASKKIAATARRRGLVAATAEQCRRAIGQRTIHWAFSDGLLGDPTMWWAIQARWQDPEPVGGWSWRADRRLGGCGMVMDSGAHWVDTMRYWFGEIDSVFARVEQVRDRRFRKGGRVVRGAQEDFWTAIFNFKSGLAGTWSWTISAPGKGFTQLTLAGTRGSIVDSDIFHPAAFQANGECQLADGTTYSMGKLQEMFLETLSAARREELFPYGITAGVPLELWDFIDALSRGRPVEIDAEEGMRSKAVSEAIYESGKSGQVVKVADVVSGKVDALAARPEPLLEAVKGARWLSMSPVLDHDGQRSCAHPDKDLNEQVAAVLRHAVDAHREELQVYESLRNLNEVDRHPVRRPGAVRVDSECARRAPVRRPRAHSREACRSRGEPTLPFTSPTAAGVFAGGTSKR